MNKNIIIAILIVIIIAVVAAFALSHPAQTQDGKLNTQINFLSKDTLKNGEQIEFELKDAQGKAIAGQKVNISYSDKGKVQNYSVITDNNGKGYLTINGESAGSYEVTINYGGNAQYNGCTAKKTITVEEGTSTQNATQTPANSTTSTVKYNNGTAQGSSSSKASSSQSYYDAELNEYFDQNGKIIGGQNAGSNIWEVRNNQPVVTENGLE